jgi:hypothetical protein
MGLLDFNQFQTTISTKILRHPSPSFWFYMNLKMLAIIVFSAEYCRQPEIAIICPDHPVAVMRVGINWPLIIL